MHETAGGRKSGGGLGALPWSFRELCWPVRRITFFAAQPDDPVVVHVVVEHGRMVAEITDASIAAPSGKTADTENFPVGSLLIAPSLRPHVMLYYRFARMADDIADSAALTPKEKVRRLDIMDAGLAPGADGPPVSTRLADSMAATGVSTARASDLLIAFRSDARKARYATWGELMGYCAQSAHPVGRYLLDLHGEDPTTGPLGDALCAALQVINHLQDIGDDRRMLDRVYLPTDWMEEEKVGMDALDFDRTGPALRRVIDRCLDGTDGLLARSVPLAGATRSRRLAAEIAVIQTLAERLAARLRREDPLAGRVRHDRRDFARAGIAGLLRLCRLARPRMPALGPA